MNITNTEAKLLRQAVLFLKKDARTKIGSSGYGTSDDLVRKDIEHFQQVDILEQKLVQWINQLPRDDSITVI